MDRKLAEIADGVPRMPCPTTDAKDEQAAPAGAHGGQFIGHLLDHGHIELAGILSAFGYR